MRDRDLSQWTKHTSSTVKLSAGEDTLVNIIRYVLPMPAQMGVRVLEASISTW